MPLPGNLKVLSTLMLDAIFPRFCVNCGVEGRLLCRACEMTWQHDPPVGSDGHIAFYAYANPVVRKLICAWKYDYDLSAFEILTEQTQDILPEFIAGARELGIQAIVPLPLSAKRLRERGFNQSRMLADWIAKELNVPVIDALARVHRRGHQAERSNDEREEAMRNSPFLIQETKKLPSVVLLVDDVWTTGATMQAAKQIMEAQDRTRVFGLTLAKG